MFRVKARLCHIKLVLGANVYWTNTIGFLIEYGTHELWNPIIKIFNGICYFKIVLIFSSGGLNSLIGNYLGNTEIQIFLIVYTRKIFFFGVKTV